MNDYENKLRAMVDQKVTAAMEAEAERIAQKIIANMMFAPVLDVAAKTMPAMGVTVKNGRQPKWRQLAPSNCWLSFGDLSKIKMMPHNDYRKIANDVVDFLGNTNPLSRRDINQMLFNRNQSLTPGRISVLLSNVIARGIFKVVPVPTYE
jgi:hypothetical protein